MNALYPYLIPGSQVDPTIFVANSTLILGSFSKSVDMIMALSVDYSQLIASFTPQKFSFKVKPGGEPQLAITNSSLTGEVLAFTVKGGISGQSYEVVINMTGVAGNTRSDVLTVNILDDGCGCAIFPMPTYPLGNVSADGSVIVNTAPRFFVSATFPVAPNVLDRWYDTTTGSIYDYVSNGLETYWQVSGDGSGGGGGSGGGSAANIITLASITPDGVTTTFTLSAPSATVNVIQANTLFVSVDGVWQEPLVQYVTAGNMIQFNEAPLAYARVFMLWFAPPIPPEN